MRKSQKSHQAARRRHNQGRAEDFGIPWALIYSARGASENFLSAPCKFLSASPFFLTFTRALRNLSGALRKYSRDFFWEHPIY